MKTTRSRGEGEREEKKLFPVSNLLLFQLELLKKSLFAGYWWCEQEDEIAMCCKGEEERKSDLEGGKGLLIGKMAEGDGAHSVT